ncbi:MAG: T9SS type A sorting domain-containing protein, partial [Bacteroidota bacterium]
IQSLEIYGLAFSIVYDPQLVDPNTVWMNSENSWLLENDANGGLFLYRNDPENHQINVALVRTDLTDVMGSGSIGQLNFQLLEGFNGDLSFEIRNVRLINLAEQVFETEGKTTNVTVRTTSSSEQRYLQQAVHISPNPVRDFLNVQYPASLEIERMEVWDMAGRYINAYNNKNQYLDVRDLQSGLYILKLYTNEGKAVKSFLKAK